MQKQPASDSGLPAQGDGAGAPAKPSAAHTPKPSPPRPGQTKPKQQAKQKSAAKPESMAKPSPTTTTGGVKAAPKPEQSRTEATKKPQETMPGSAGAHPRPPRATQAQGSVAAATKNSDSGKPTGKPGISPANLAKPGLQSARAPKPVTPVTNSEKSTPGSNNLENPSDKPKPASPDQAQKRQQTSPTGPKPGPKLGTSRPVTEAQTAGTAVAQPDSAKTPGQETVEAVKQSEAPIKQTVAQPAIAQPAAGKPAPAKVATANQTTAKPSAPKKPVATSAKTTQVPDAQATPHVPSEGSKAPDATSSVGQTLAPSTPKAPAASVKSVKPSTVSNTGQAATVQGKPAQTDRQNPVVEPSASAPTDSLLAPESFAPEVEAPKPHTDVKDAVLERSEPDVAAEAEALGSAPDKTPKAPLAEPTKPGEPETPDIQSAPALKSPGAQASSGIMNLLLGVSFVLEVALLGAVAFGAMWALPQLNPIVAILVTVVPLMILWGLFMSPKASFRIASLMHAILSHALFVGGAVLLFLAGQPVLAIGMGVLTLLSLVLTLMVGGHGAVTEALAARKPHAGGPSGTGKGSGRRAAR